MNTDETPPHFGIPLEDNPMAPLKVKLSSSDGPPGLHLLHALWLGPSTALSGLNITF